MPKVPMLFVAFVLTISVPVTPTLLAQSKAIFVLPTLEPSSTPAEPTPDPAATVQPHTQPSGLMVVSLDTPAGRMHELCRRHPAPEVAPELVACRKRYADAVYNIGLALWTAPPVQHQALERLLNASSAIQSVAMDPQTNGLNAPLCADTTLTGLEATVTRLKAKGWVPMTQVEEHVARSSNLGDELKRAVDAIWR
jgi:hypothetical protein